MENRGILINGCPFLQGDMLVEMVRLIEFREVKDCFREPHLR